MLPEHKEVEGLIKGLVSAIAGAVIITVAFYIVLRLL